MAEKYNGIEKYIWSDTYLMFLKYKDCENTETTWENIANDAEFLFKKYKKRKLANDMIVATINQLMLVIK